MTKRAKFSIVLLFTFIISLLSPSSSFAETPEPPLELDGIKPIFQTISAAEESDSMPTGGIPRIGENWIANGNAESATTNWAGNENDFIQSVAYGTTNTPLPQDPGPTLRGISVFTGKGTNLEKNAWQDWGISPSAFSLPTGKVRYTLSGYLGGQGTRSDSAVLRVYFGQWNSDLSPKCIGSISAQIGPVTAADRGFKTGLLERTTRGLVPAGTNCLTFQLQMFTQDASAGTAFADNLSFVINGLPVYLPLISSPLASPSNTIPAAPSNPTITQTNLTSLGLSWKDNSNNETGFVIQRAIGNSNTYTILALLGPGVTNYVDKGLTPATFYKYLVAAQNGKGISSYAPVTGSTSTATTIPNMPANCWTSNTGSSSTELGWTDSSNNEEYFILNIQLPGDIWRWLANVAPDASYVTIIDLPYSDTTYFRIFAHNASGESAYCQTSATTGNAQNQLTVINLASYPIVSLEIDGVEQFPVYPMGLVTDNNYQIYLEPGAHSVIATTGFWQNETDRFYMYSYFQDFTLSSGSYYLLEIPDITINELLTQFSPSGYWEGYYFDSSANCHTKAFLFEEDGSYQFFEGGVPKGIGAYSLQTRLPETYSVKFNVTGYVNNYEGWLFETYGQFYMNNGPAGWNQITYVYKPQGYVRNPFCP